MKSVLSLLVISSALCGSAYAATATHTGQMEYGFSVTGQQVVRCEYTTGASKFWVTIKGAFCPATIEVE